jgi:hypothetical protein
MLQKGIRRVVACDERNWETNEIGFVRSDAVKRNDNEDEEDREDGEAF